MRWSKRSCCRWLPRLCSRGCCISCLRKQRSASSLLLNMQCGRIEKFAERRRCPCPRLRRPSRTAALPIVSCRGMTNESISCFFISPYEIKNVYRVNRLAACCSADSREEKDALADSCLRVAAARADRWRRVQVLNTACRNEASAHECKRRRAG